MNATAGPAVSSCQEDYLEAILSLVRANRVARVRDIARELGVGMPSVSSALKSLSRRKLVNYDPYQFVTLTDAGRELAEQVSRRHHDLRRFLVDVLGIDEPAAGANACRMEHAVDEEVLVRLRRLTEFMASCPRTGHNWVESFHRLASEGRCGPSSSCGQCIARDEVLAGAAVPATKKTPGRGDAQTRRNGGNRKKAAVSHQKAAARSQQ